MASSRLRKLKGKAAGFLSGGSHRHCNYNSSIFARAGVPTIANHRALPHRTSLKAAGRGVASGDTFDLNHNLGHLPKTTRRAVGASKTHSARASTQRAHVPIARQTPPARARRSDGGGKRCGGDKTALSHCALVQEDGEERSAHKIIILNRYPRRKPRAQKMRQKCRFS